MKYLIKIYNKKTGKLLVHLQYENLENFKYDFKHRKHLWEIKSTNIYNLEFYDKDEFLYARQFTNYDDLETFVSNIKVKTKYDLEICKHEDGKCEN